MLVHLGMYDRTIELKKTNDIKVLLAVGGWNFGSGPFSDMVADDRLRKEFVKQATQFVRDHRFDGLDLDWVRTRGAKEGQRFLSARRNIPQVEKAVGLQTSNCSRLWSRFVSRESFVRDDEEHGFTQELRVAFQPYNLLLTAAVGAGKETIENGYEIDQLAPHLDFINLMTYDLHGGSWENITGIHTALYARAGEPENSLTLNQVRSARSLPQKSRLDFFLRKYKDWAVNHWIENGMPKEKICMGVATYGRTFELLDASSNALGAIGIGPGAPGNYTREEGFLAYYEVRQVHSENMTYLFVRCRLDL